jgi:hypothetical protein
MSLVEFPYVLHKGYLMPVIPITLMNSRVWMFVDSGATFSVISAVEASGLGIEWNQGSLQMIVVGDGSYIPVYLHDLTLRIGGFELVAPIGFSERLGVGFNLLGRTGIFDQFQVCFNDHARKLTFEKI